MSSIEAHLTRIAAAQSDTQLSNIVRDVEAQMRVEHAPTAHWEAVRHAARERMLFFARRMVA